MRREHGRPDNTPTHPADGCACLHSYSWQQQSFIWERETWVWWWGADKPIWRNLVSFVCWDNCLLRQNILKLANYPCLPLHLASLCKIQAGDMNDIDIECWLYALTLNIEHPFGQKTDAIIGCMCFVNGVCFWKTNNVLILLGFGSMVNYLL